MALQIHPSLRLEIPEFLQDSVVYCDSLIFKRNEKSCFLFSKDLKFFEFRKKNLLNCLNLNETSISKLRQKILLYEGRKCKLNSDFEGNGIQTTTDSKAEINITIGKYIYRNFDIQKLYLLLRCWNILIILERNLTDGIKFIAEYENVVNFKIISNTSFKYQAVIKILFEDESTICTNLQTEFSKDSGIEDTKSSEFKHLLDRVRTTKAELQLHKEITHKQFQSLCNDQNFGNNLIRSTKLEEKPLLTRYGDVWLRITANDELVIGLPLINNCTTPNLTVLKKLQPIFNFCDYSTHKSYEQKHVHVEHYLYQLSDTFDNLNSLETVFQNQDFYFQDDVWTSSKEMPPNSFMIMLIKLKLSQLILIKQNCQLFVRFIVEKELKSDESETYKFEQHIFIKTLDFQQIFHQRLKYNISFKEHTFHQDFLAIAVTSNSRKLSIKFISSTDLEKFEHLLVNKFEFEKVCHALNTEPHTICNSTVEMNESFNNHDFSGNVFFNNKSKSIWYGSLVLQRDLKDTMSINEEEALTSNWIFYNKNEDKSNLMIKLILDDLISIKCNIENLKEAACSSDNKFVMFENAIRKELNVFSNLYQDINKNSKDLKKKFQMLAEHQFRTDCLSADIQ